MPAFSNGFSAGFDVGPGSVISAPGHGLVEGDQIWFVGIDPDDSGIDESVPYYVLHDPTLDAFKFSLTRGGDPFVLTLPITDGRILFGDTYVPVEDGVMDPPTIPEVPPTPEVTTDTVDDADGTTISRLIITLTPPTEDKTRSYYVQVTFVNDGDPANPQPVWDENSATYTLPPGATSLAIDGVPGNVPFYVRCWVDDVFGQVSAASGHAEVTSTPDTKAPSIPTGLVTAPDIKGAFVQWAPASAKDLAFYELRFAPDNGTGTAPDTAQWTYLRQRSNSVYIGGLVADSNADGIADKRYWLQVRAIDSTGNVDDGTGVAVNFLSNQETGWCTAVSVDPQLAGSEDIGVGAIKPTHIEYLTADKIKTGDLTINTSDNNLIDGIKVKKDTNADGIADTLVGLWNETGLFVYSATDSRDYAHLYEGGLHVYKDGAEVASVTPDGINAAGVNFGVLSGGHNVLLNSGFEAADFASVTWTTVNWTAAADWTGTNISATNITTGTGALTMTGVTY